MFLGSSVLFFFCGLLVLALSFIGHSFCVCDLLWFPVLRCSCGLGGGRCSRGLECFKMFVTYMGRFTSRVDRDEILRVSGDSRYSFVWRGRVFVYWLSGRPGSAGRCFRSYGFA